MHPTHKSILQCSDKQKNGPENKGVYGIKTLPSKHISHTLIGERVKYGMSQCLEIRLWFVSGQHAYFKTLRVSENSQIIETMFEQATSPESNNFI